MLIGPKVPPYPKVLIHPNVHLSQSPHALNALLSHIAYLFAPNAHLLWCSFFLVAISPQVPICPKCPLAPNLIGPKMPICPKMPISSNVHLSQSSHAHLSQTPICPKCSFAPIAQCPFALVLIFPGGHFPPMPICHQLPSIAPISIGPKVPICFTVPICFINANVIRSQSAHLLHSAHLPHKCPFALALIFPGVHLPQVPICFQCPLAPKLIGPKCSFVLVPTSFQRPFVPNTLFPQSAHLHQLPIYPGAHFSWCPFSPSTHLPPMPTWLKAVP